MSLQQRLRELIDGKTIAQVRTDSGVAPTTSMLALEFTDGSSLEISWRPDVAKDGVLTFARTTVGREPV